MARRITAALRAAVATGSAAAWARAVGDLLIDASHCFGWLPCEVRPGATNPIATLAEREPELFPHPIYFLRKDAAALHWQDVILLGRPAGDVAPECSDRSELPPVWWGQGLGLVGGRPTGLVVASGVLDRSESRYAHAFVLLNSIRPEGAESGHHAGTGKAA